MGGINKYKQRTEAQRVFLTTGGRRGESVIYTYLLDFRSHWMLIFL